MISLITEHVRERYYRECIGTLYIIANFSAKVAVLITATITTTSSVLIEYQAETGKRRYSSNRRFPSNLAQLLGLVTKRLWQKICQKIFYSLQVRGTPLKCMHIELAIVCLVFLQQEKSSVNEIYWITFYSYQFQSIDIRKSRVQIPFWPLADVVLGSLEFNFSATLVNSQLVYLPPAGILKA